jgi:hypothetical protein
MRCSMSLIDRSLWDQLHMSARYPPAFRPQRDAGALLGADKVSAWEDGRIARHELLLAYGLRRYGRGFHYDLLLGFFER